MKTVFIFEEIPESLKFFVKDGDFSVFNGVYVNSSQGSEEQQSSLCDLVYKDAGTRETGYYNVDFLDRFPTDVVKSNDCIVIQCGFYL